MGKAAAVCGSSSIGAKWDCAGDSTGAAGVRTGESAAANLAGEREGGSAGGALGREWAGGRLGSEWAGGCACAANGAVAGECEGGAAAGGLAGPGTGVAGECDAAGVGSATLVLAATDARRSGCAGGSLAICSCCMSHTHLRSKEPRTSNPVK
jgi:hypothetical protein